MIKIGLIGYGYWGPNLVRNFSETPGAQLVGVADLDEKRLQLLKTRYPAVSTTSDYKTLLADTSIDVIAIATPVSSHYQLALEALQAGKNVFIEKPLTETVEQGQHLIDEAARRNLVLHVDHTFVYTGAVRKIHELVKKGELGDMLYYDSVRINLGLFQPDVSVLWDLAVHDLAIMDYVFPSTPCAVSATGISHVPGKPANIAFLTLFFEDSAIAHLHVNWLSPVKVRRTLIGGNRKMIVYDDMELSEKVKVYDKGITLNGNKENLYNTLIGYRAGDMWSPQLEITEALKVEAQHFIRCVDRKEHSITDGRAGLRIVRILEAADRSVQQRGQPIELNQSAKEL